MLLLAGIEHQRMFNQCTPIDPYHGMPKDYKDYNLILNRSLNDMILKSPCREGFKFVGMKSTSDMLQCKEGFWKGSFPKCEGEINLCSNEILFYLQQFAYSY